MSDIKILAEAILEQQAHGQLCPQMIEELKKIRGVTIWKQIENLLKM